MFRTVEYFQILDCHVRWFMFQNVPRFIFVTCAKMENLDFFQKWYRVYIKNERLLTVLSFRKEINSVILVLVVLINMLELVSLIKVALITERVTKTLIIIIVPKPGTQCQVWNISTVWNFLPLIYQISKKIFKLALNSRVYWQTLYTTVCFYAGHRVTHKG